MPAARIASIVTTRGHGDAGRDQDPAIT